MEKRLFSLVIVLICMQITAYAQKFTAVNAEGVKIKYEVTSTNERTVQVTGGERDDELIIPATVTYKDITYQVTAIKKNAYRRDVRVGRQFRRLVLPEGLIEIGNNAFLFALKYDIGCKIYIPSSVKVIGEDAFSSEGWRLDTSYQLENLPLIVHENNCKFMGISPQCIQRYYAYHPRSSSAEQPANAQNDQAILTPTVQQQPENIPSSDVDINLPLSSSENSNTFAIIIANENYQEEENVEFALNDGEMFQQYCRKVLGLPENNIHLRKDATLNNIKTELTWIQQVAKAYKGKARFIVYYAGHGIPDEKQGSCYLLPIDGKGTIKESGLSLASFYEQLGTMEAENVTVFMDACFSGSKRGEGMLTSARGIAIKSKTQTPKGKMVVFSAAQGDETAYPYKEKRHGLFTYFLLKKLQETNGNVNYDELGQYICDQVSRISIVDNGKSQTPSVTPSQSIINSWKTLKLK